MSVRFATSFFAWAALLALLALEVAASALPLTPSLRPLLLIFALAMAGIILTSFMEVEQGPSPIRLFAVAGFVWLIILLALGSLDPLTRLTYFDNRIRNRPFGDDPRYVVSSGSPRALDDVVSATRSLGVGAVIFTKPSTKRPKKVFRSIE